MIIFNKSYKTPEENLAIDEYLLQEVNNGIIQTVFAVFGIINVFVL